MTVGGRYDWVSTDTDNTDLSTNALTRFRKRTEAFSGAHVGLGYETDFGVVPCASYSTAFTPNAGINQATGQPFKPTESEQEEIGVKYLLPDTNAYALRRRCSASIRRTACIARSSACLPGPASIQVPASQVRSRGLELEANASLDNGLSLVAVLYLYGCRRSLRH